MSSPTNSTPIMYFLLGDSSKVHVIFEYIILKNPQTQHEAMQIFDKLSKSPDKKIEQRNKIQSKNGNYYFTICHPNIFYLVLANPNYPERNIFDLIDAVHKDNIPLLLNEKGEINSGGKQILKSLIDKYQDHSRIVSIKSEVDEIKIDMNQNIRQVVSNMEDIKHLEESSDKIKERSAEYQQNSKALARATWCRNCKFTIIIVTIVIGILLAIILPICLRK